MTDVGRNAIRRSRKQDRRLNRKQKRHRVAAGVAAMATVAAVGAGQAMTPQAAEAASISDILAGVTSGALGGNSGLGQLGALKDGLMEVVNGGGADIAEQWRIQLCGSGGSNGGADCSRSTGVGLAIVAPGRIELVPVAAWDTAAGVYNFFDAIDNVLPENWQIIPDLRDPEEPFGNATIIGDGFQFAFASTGGQATAISFLPVSLATAGASDGRTAYAFALVGMANAWTTDDITTSLVGIDLPITIPGIEHVSCYGGLTGAYAEGVGACANVLGTFDFRWKAANEVQFGLTDPTGVLFDPQTVLTNLITAVLTNVTGNGDLPITLSKDFGRLSFGGDYDLLSGNFVRFTSDYGSQAPTTIKWLGQQITLNPMVTVNGQQRPNHIGAPVIVWGELDTGEIIPIYYKPEIDLPFGLAPIGPVTFPPASSTTLTTSTLRAAPDDVDESAPAVTSARTDAATSDDTSTEPEAISGTDTSTSGVEATGSYVGKHRADDSAGGYVGKHRDDDSASGTGAQGSGSGEPASGGSATDSTDSGSSDSGSSDSGSSDSGSSDSSSSDSGSSDSSSADSSSSATDSGATDSGSTSGSGSSGSTSTGSGSSSSTSGSDSGD
ncbi:hypothetical protein [Gordonia insulae]|uniref:Uncharacterized protein n=1 Tax=Gordonia insulae TaxID=2420509 RepID=A0A3G8JSY6_9ACTN|nr:hypothetical protein [Gordonia insulae]AZG48221.1 hypothetical protein D7316_04838 [Gordonia insulae]